jgi:ribosomal protein S19E (S16A)
LILQQAETGGLLKKAEGNKKGRMLTDEGKELLESVA